MFSESFGVQLAQFALAHASRAGLRAIHAAQRDTADSTLIQIIVIA